MSGMQENRKKQIFFQLCKAGHFSQQSPALPSAGVALGKVTKPLPSASTRQRLFLKKIFAECPTWQSAKNFSKKNAECLTRQHSAKNFSKKNSFAECLTRRHSAKGAVKLTAPVTFAECWCGTRQILCRVLPRGTRQRFLCRPLLCRVGFAESRTRQSLCRRQRFLYRVRPALGKGGGSSSGQN